MSDIVTGYDEEFVRQLYRIILNRDPDLAGLEHHLNALRAGVPPHEIVAEFLCSKEYTARSRPEELPPAALFAPDRVDSLNRRLMRLEKSSHGGKAVYVGDGRILTKVDLGVWSIGYLLEANDLLLAPHLVIDGYHEIDITNFFIRNVKQGDNCLDVGANFGYFTCIMARWSVGGKTIALEPAGKIFELLRDNIYINSLEGTAVARHAAATDKTGIVRLYRRITRSGNTSIAKVPDDALAGMGEPASVPFEVTCVPIDSLLPEFDGRVDYVKIDVEGAEPLVLRGAKAIIANNPHVKIVMEWSPGQVRQAGFDPADFTNELAALGLSAAVIVTDGAEPVSWDALRALSYCPGILLTCPP